MSKTSASTELIYHSSLGREIVVFQNLKHKPWIVLRFPGRKSEKEFLVSTLSCETHTFTDNNKIMISLYSVFLKIAKVDSQFTALFIAIFHKFTIKDSNFQFKFK